MDLNAKREEHKTAIDLLLAKAQVEERELTDAEDRDCKYHQAAVRHLGTPVGKPPLPQPDRSYLSGRAPAGHVRLDPADYSVRRLMRGLMHGDLRDCRVEVRASDELRERDGGDSRGQVRVPWTALSPVGWEQRDLQVGNTGAGLVGTDLLPSEFVDVLRPRSVAIQAGATVIPNAVGNVDFPVLAAGATHTWLATETTDLTTDTAQDLNTISFTPKTVGIRADFTRRMALQSTPAAEQVVRNDIAKRVATAVDLAAIQGSGSSGEPTGIVNTSGVGAVDLGGTPQTTTTWSDVVELETDVGTSDGLAGSLAYATTPAMAGALKTIILDAGSGRFIMEAGGSISSVAMGFRINGYPAFSTSNCPTDQIVFGNWRDLVLVQWGSGVDLFADPYTLGDRGGVVIRGFLDLDVGVRHAASFSVGS